MKAILLLLLICVTFPRMLPAQGLQLNNGVYFVAAGSANVVLNNMGIVNNGIFVPGAGTLLFTGDNAALTSYIGGDRKISLYNVIIAMAPPGLRLDNDVTLEHTITLDSGNLELNGHLLDLGSTGNIIGERSGACITGITGGVIRVTAELNAPQDMNPGNIGAAVSSPSDLGEVTIIRGHVAQAVAGGGSGIRRYFEITPSVNGGLQATLRFYYLDAELGGNNKNGLMLYSAAKDGGGWQALGSAGDSKDSSWVLQTHLDELQRFTLADGVAISTDRVTAEAYPNPSQDAFQLKLTSSREKDAVIGLYDGAGRLLEVKRVHCLAGTTLAGWGMARYAPGVYYLRFQGLIATDLKLIHQ